MSALPAIPLVVDRPWHARTGRVLAHAWARVDWRVLCACIGIIASSMVWNWLRWQHYMSTSGPDVVPPEVWWSILLVESLSATLLVAAILVADAAAEDGAPLVASYALAVIVGAAAAALLQPFARHLLHLRVSADMAGTPPDVAAMQPWYVFLDLGLRASVLVVAYVSLRTEARARARRLAAELARARAQRRTFESRLQAMQARVEPQFLFNTLGRVGTLHAIDPPAANALLDDLIGYLRAALPHLRLSSSTLGQEADLAGAYARIRSPPGTSVRIEIDTGLREARMPPMILLPMIDHVLAGEPFAACHGAALVVAASVSHGRLRVSVTCPGATTRMATPPATLLERIEALYGPAATLAVEDDGAGLACVALAIPHEVGEPTRAGAGSRDDIPGVRVR